MRILILSVLTAALLCSTGTARAEWHVWTTTRTRHVLRDEPAEKGDDVNLAAARNEWRSFQILMRADEPIGGINLVAGDLSGPDGAVLSSSEARLYRQHQLHITTPSYRHQEFNAKPGWYPDALIPFANPLTGKPLRGARFQAVPFDLPAQQTHGFWVDVYVPATAKPGVYRGAYRVTAGDGKTVEIPVRFTVWDFELPAVPTMKTAFGSPISRVRRYYERRKGAENAKKPTDWAAVDRQCAAMLCDHHINATPPKNLVPVAQADGSFRIPDAEVDAPCAVCRSVPRQCRTNLAPKPRRRGPGSPTGEARCLAGQLRSGGEAIG